MIRGSVVLLSLAIAVTAAANTETVRRNLSDLHNRATRDMSLPRGPMSPTGLTPGIFKQNLDHFGAQAGQTFDQRYWVNSDYAKSGAAPVILHICGEGDAEVGYFLHDNALEWAKALGARVVYLEHRYYGKSLPYTDLSSEHLKFLTLDNVIEDLATFQKSISASQGWTGSWISVGGSYSGTLSAIYRYRHPELVVGALAASAPMISGQGESEGTQNDVDELSSIDPSDDSGSRQWVYQSCINFGYWETDGFNIYEPNDWLCHQLFGNVSLVDKQLYNQTYYTPYIEAQGAPSNILFTYGTDDIWTNIGLAQANNSNSKITIRTINGAGHHFDLNYPDPSDNSDVRAARAEFLKDAKAWLGAN